MPFSVAQDLVLGPLLHPLHNHFAVTHYCSGSAVSAICWNGFRLISCDWILQRHCIYLAGQMPLVVKRLWIFDNILWMGFPACRPRTCWWWIMWTFFASPAVTLMLLFSLMHHAWCNQVLNFLHASQNCVSSLPGWHSLCSVAMPCFYTSTWAHHAFSCIGSSS